MLNSGIVPSTEMGTIYLTTCTVIPMATQPLCVHLFRVSPPQVARTRDFQTRPALLIGVFTVVVSSFLTGCRREKPAMAAPPPPVVSVTRPVIYPVQNYYEYNGNLDAVEMVEVRARVA